MLWSHASPYLVLILLNIFQGSIVTLGTGLSIHVTGLNIFIAAGVLIIGSIIGDTLYYFVGRKGEWLLHSRAVRFIGIKEKHLANVAAYYHRHGKFTLFAGKMSDVLSLPAVIMAGATKMFFSDFILISVISSILKTIVLLLAGYLLSGSIRPDGAPALLNIFSGMFVLVIAVLLFRYFYVKIKTH